MKKLIFELNDILYDLAFQDGLLKGRTPILLLVVEACRYMMHNEQVANASRKLILVVDDMNRLFFCEEKKMFSVVFPFHINEYPKVRFDMHNIPLDGKMFSDINRVLDSDWLAENDPFDFIDPIVYFQEENPNLWIVMRHLMTYEIGYIRYDDDVENFKKAARKGMPKQHPHYHYDVNLDPQATFKIGLPKKISPNAFMDFLNNKKERLFLK